MRLNRYLSQCGIASRRGAEQIILEGRVSINGHVIKNLATQVVDGDKVIVDGKPVRTEAPVVIALNKPRGYICSHGDTHERMTIYDLLPLQYQQLHHVGRLDKESEGLLLMTNRGDLSHRLMHPSMGAEKEYEVVVDQAMNPEVMAKLIKGMLTEEGHAKAERAWLDTTHRAHVVLKQGLKRQIRLMFYHLGYEVQRLTRIRIGWLQLRGLQLGGWKEIKPTDVERFFKDAPQAARERPRAGKKNAEDDADSDTIRPTSASRRPRASGASKRPSGPAKRPGAASKRPGSPAKKRPSSRTERPERPSSPGKKRPSSRTERSDRPERPKGRSNWSKTRKPR